MCRAWVLYLAFIAVAVTSISAQNRVATAHLVAENVTGTITFTEVDNGLQVTGTIVGLRAGRYGFHIHESGDIATCDASGAHFNPDGTTHGGPEDEIRHVGDLGNVEFEATGQATVNIFDSVISLRGRNSILGRILMLHAGEDDLGQGGDGGSLATGNAGARVACGVIGITAPLDPWNSAASAPPFDTLLVSAMSLYVLYTNYF